MISVINGTSETIPPRAAVKITSFDQSTGLAIVGKVAFDGDAAIFFSGAAPIPSGSKGTIERDPHLAVAAYQADDGDDPAHGETWGTVAGSWYLHKRPPGFPGFEVIGDGAYGLCNVISQPRQGWNWTATKSAADSPYQAQPGDAITCDLVAGGINIDLPPWADLPADQGNVRIDVITWTGGGGGIRNVFVEPTVGDLINGNAGQWALDDGDGAGMIVGDSGGSWIFQRTGNSDIQWSCSRHLCTPPP